VHNNPLLGRQEHEAEFTDSVQERCQAKVCQCRLMMKDNNNPPCWRHGRSREKGNSTVEIFCCGLFPNGVGNLDNNPDCHNVMFWLAIPLWGDQENLGSLGWKD